MEAAEDADAADMEAASTTEEAAEMEAVSTTEEQATQPEAAAQLEPWRQQQEQ